MKNVLVTGGSRGIGRAIVKMFCANGYKVAFTYNSNREMAESLACDCGAIPIQADFTDPSAVLRAAQDASNALSGVDVLINNAAISSFSLLTDISEKTWRDTFAVNVDAPFMLSKALLPYMINKKCGSIINISSMWGEVGSSCEVHYSASKAALIGFTKALAKEVGPSGITVNCIAPGVIDTEMNASLSSETITALAEETPLMRIGEADDVASAALFLASEGAKFITGAVIHVNGGFVV